MSLTTFAVPDPAPGADWAFTVPGINLVAVQTIVGRYRTDLANPNFVLVRDASGNGHNLGISEPPSIQHLMVQQPGALADDAATAFSDQAGATSYGTAVGGPFPEVDLSGDFTVEWWQQVASSAQEPIPLVWALPGPALWSVSVDSSNDVTLSRGVGLSFVAPACFIPDGNWHYYAWTFDQANQANVQFYVDGLAVGGVIRPGGYPARPVGVDQFILGDDNPLNECGALDEVAFYPLALPPGQVLANWAASALGVAGYTARILGAGAVTLWHLDELATDADRLPTLDVLNGAILLGEYPASAVQSVGKSVQYTWFADARGTPGTATPTIVTVGIPALVLPPGYVLRSATAGIQPSDQWSGVRILWNDALQAIGPGYNPYDYPPGAFLTYRQIGTTP